MKLAFRADASVMQGTGHVVRSLTLALEFQKSGHAVRMISSIQGLPWLKSMVEKSEIEVETCSQHELNNSTLFSGELDLLVIDSYEIPNELINNPSMNLSTMAIVDGDMRGIKAKVLLDHNLDAKRFRADADTHQLIGPRFALVRKEIREIRRTSILDVKRNFKPALMVMIGGADHAQIAVLIAKMLSGLDSEFEIHFVTSENNIQEISSYLPNNSSNIRPFAPDIHTYLKEIDVVISAAGTSTLDLSCIGIPTIYVAVAENQFQNFSAISKLEIGYALGRLGEIVNMEEDLIEKIHLCVYDDDIRQKFFENSQLLVDGLGASRVVAEIEKLFEANLFRSNG